MHEVVIPHRILRVWGQTSNSKRGTRARMGKSHKQGLTSAKYLTIELLEGRENLTERLPNLTFSLT